MKDEDLAKGLKMTPVDLRKLCAKLKSDGLIKMNAKTEEIKEYRHTKKVTKAHYYIDYRSFVNVIKYKMYRIQEIIKKEVDSHNNNLEYICPACQLDYDPLKALALNRNDEQMFLCEICSTPLEQKEALDMENDLSKKFNTARKRLLDLLQEADSQEIPEFEPNLVLGTSSAPSKESSDLSFSTESGAQASKIMVELQGFNEEIEEQVKEEAGDVDSHYKEYYANLSRAAVSGKREAEPPDNYDSPSNFEEQPSKKLKLDAFDEDDDDDEDFEEDLAAAFTDYAALGMNDIAFCQRDHAF
ncbi:hypothetical protein HDU67_010263 [Dinochytrium kinnereticum]|nr:hypothetical protein HDU67_010263 [Dinochytrium kinnereticum]